VLFSTIALASFGGRVGATPISTAPIVAPVISGLPVGELPIGQAAVSPTAAPVLAAATSVLGTPYRYGGAAPGGFDCSGLTSWAWSHAGVRLPRSSGAQRAATRPVAAADLQPGDLVFYGSPVSHVALYLGDGMVVHSPKRGDVVRIVPVNRAGMSPSGFGRVK
jgi:cell wall-associated NlpC family hydrolase